MRKEIIMTAYSIIGLLTKNKKKMLVAAGVFLAGELYRIVSSKYLKHLQEKANTGSEAPVPKKFSNSSGRPINRKYPRANWMPREDDVVKH